MYILGGKLLIPSGQYMGWVNRKLSHQATIRAISEEDERKHKDHHAMDKDQTMIDEDQNMMDVDDIW